MGTLESMLEKIKQDNTCSEIRKDIAGVFGEVLEICNETMDTCNETMGEIGGINSQIQVISEELSQVFQSVSSGKQLIATAITGKGINTSSNDTFQTMATNISNISGGSGNVNGVVFTLDGESYKLIDDGSGNITAILIETEKVVGTIDTSKSISLTGLESGTYTLKYEDDTSILSDFDIIATMEV